MTDPTRVPKGRIIGPVGTRVEVGDARSAALGHLIDYAGLFPPASREMEGAVAGYRAARTGSAAWIAGRFLCPTSRLEELAGLLTATMTADEDPWEVGAVFDEEPGIAASHAATFHRYTDPAARITSAEAGISHGAGRAEIETIFKAAASITAEVVPFLEVPRTEAWEEEIPIVVDHIADTRTDWRRNGGAKIRCGGLGPTAFPSPEQVACFIIACTRRGLPFKATAGLHHPVRHWDEDLDVMRHGFLNLLLATAVAAEADDVPFHEVAAVVAERDASAFSVGAGSIAYRDHRFPIRSVAAVRTSGFTAYGSCDFQEPVSDLVSMGAVV